MTRNLGPRFRMRFSGVLVLAAFAFWTGVAPDGLQPAGRGGEGLAKLEREGKAEDGRLSERLTGLWSGSYHYPADSGRESVKFNAIMVYDGKTVVGFMKEPNTFGNAGEPLLHALGKGRLDEQTGKLTLTKTYDGSAGVEHSVEYNGELSKDRMKIEGTWAIGDYSGSFTLEKQRLEDRALENLK